MIINVFMPSFDLQLKFMVMLSQPTPPTTSLAPDGALTVENKHAETNIYEATAKQTTVQTMATHVTAQAHVTAAAIRTAT